MSEGTVTVEGGKCSAGVQVCRKSGFLSLMLSRKLQMLKVWISTTTSAETTKVSYSPFALEDGAKVECESGGAEHSKNPPFQLV